MHNISDSIFRSLVFPHNIICIGMANSVCICTWTPTLPSFLYQFHLWVFSFRGYFKFNLISDSSKSDLWNMWDPVSLSAISTQWAFQSSACAVTRFKPHPIMHFAVHFPPQVPSVANLSVERLLSSLKGPQRSVTVITLTALCLVPNPTPQPLKNLVLSGTESPVTRTLAFSDLSFF